jgi:hypothetical protein
VLYHGSPFAAPSGGIELPGDLAERPYVVDDASSHRRRGLVVVLSSLVSINDEWTRAKLQCV